MDDSLYRKDRFASSGPIQSPYLNFDPSILKTGGSQFIIPEGQSETRGKLEMGFLKIGAALFAGGAYGTLNGTFVGMRETATLAGKLKRTQVVNYVAKHGSSSAQSFGTVALMFSLYDFFLNKIRGVDDELNLVVSGAATGATYFSTRGYKKAIGGGLGGVLAVGIYLAIVNRGSWRLNKMLNDK